MKVPGFEWVLMDVKDSISNFDLIGNLLYHAVGPLLSFVVRAAMVALTFR